MIVIVSNTRREATAFATLCESRAWPCQACTSVSAFRKLSEKAEPRVVVARHRLGDGYSDDILSLLQESREAVPTQCIVLAAADFTVRQEARQVALGADCVLRDPVRVDVLIEYLAKYRSRLVLPLAGSGTPGRSFQFAGATIFPREHRIEHLGAGITVTPREIELLRILARTPGHVVTYSALYSELLGRAFSGDTANMRVLFGKVAASFLRLGVNLRERVQVIPKTGYQYLPKDHSRSGNGPKP
jgi:DNA-binding response OmpR family regulator